VTNEQSARVVRARRRDTIYQDEQPLMGALEAAQALGVKQSNLREVSNLPRPYQVLAMGSVWMASDILALAAHRQKHPYVASTGRVLAVKPGPKAKRSGAGTTSGG
jgi:hypothetical protein